VSPTRILLVHANGDAGGTLSYQRGWPRAFERDQNFDVEFLDLHSARRLPGIGPRRRRRWDAIVLVHSVYSNARYMSDQLAEKISALRLPVAWFIGNEYKNMPEKMSFAERLGVQLLVTQIESEQVRALYRGRLGCDVISIPNTGVDPDVFRPLTRIADRPIDIGYRAFAGPFYLGHDERQRLAEVYRQAAARHDLVVDLSLDLADRLGEAEWAAFLNRCRAQLGFEAGTDFFELDDRSRIAVEAYVKENVDATFDEVHERFFARYENPVSGRTISSRVIEAAATKAVQVLVEGDYGGHLLAGEHYIPLRKDFANVEETIAVLGDDAEVQRRADAAYEVVRSEFTFDRLLGRFRDALLGLRT
jgi:hypothetical protein